MNMAAITLTDPIVGSYIFYSGILALKLFAVVGLTARMRYKKKVFANEEDTKRTKGRVKFDDQDVERIRRAHHNDLENIPAFWILGALYLTTSPEASWALLLFRVYTAGRILHTLVYAVKPMPQPSRAIAFLVPYVIMWYMGVKVIGHYITAL